MKIPGIPDLKTPLLWLLGVCLVLAIASLGREHVAHLKTKAELSQVKEARATETAARDALAAADTKGVADAQFNHAGKQQGIVHDFTKPDPALAAALADNRALNQRLRDTSAKLAAAGDRREAQGDAAACGNLADQYRAVLGLLREAGQLSVQSGDLALEGRGLLAKRDGEVKALKELVLADRALMVQAAGGEVLRAPPSAMGLQPGPDAAPNGLRDGGGQ